MTTGGAASAEFRWLARPKGDESVRFMEERMHRELGPHPGCGGEWEDRAESGMIAKILDRTHRGGGLHVLVNTHNQTGHFHYSPSVHAT